MKTLPYLLICAGKETPIVNSHAKVHTCRINKINDAGIKLNVVDPNRSTFPLMKKLSIVIIKYLTRSNKH